MRVVEDVHREVEHPVGRVLERQQRLIHRPLVELGGETSRSGEVVLVEVAPANGEHAHYRQHAHAKGGPEPAFLLLETPPEQGPGGGDKDSGGDGVGPEQRDSVGHEGIDQHFGIGGVGGALEGAGYRREQRYQQAESGGEPQGPERRLPEPGFGDIALDYPVKHEEAQQRHRELQYHQRHRHRPELVVERQCGHRQFGEGEKMAADRQQDGQDRRRQQPPALPSLVAEEPQQEEEDGYGADVHRAGREGLRAPVEGHVLRHFAQVRLSGALEQLVGLGLGPHLARGGTSVVIRYHEVGKFVPAVAPGRGVVDVEPFRLAGRLASPHRILRVFPCGDELVCVGADAHHSEHEEQGGGGQEASELLFLHQHADELHQHEEEDDDGQIVGDLRMVGLHLAVHREPEEGRSQEHSGPFFGPVGVYEGRQRPRDERDGLHLGVVSYLDYLEVVGAEGDGHRAACRYERIHPEGQQQEEGPEERNEQIGGGALAGVHEKVVEPQGEVAVARLVEGNDRHAAEHRLGPGGLVVRMGGIPFPGLVRHSQIARDVALVHYLTAQNLRYEGVRQHQEPQHYQYVGEYFFPVHIDSKSLTISPVRVRRE